MATDVWIGIMAESPKKITPRLSKDVREVIKEMSKAPFGTVKSSSDFPKLTTEEVEAEKLKRTKTPPLYIKKDPKQLTKKQFDDIAKGISRERGISFNKAKQLLWEELSTSPKANPVTQPVSLSKAIPTREQLQSEGYRAVKYQGRVIYLSPAQIKQIAKDLGIKVEKAPTLSLSASEGVRVSAIPEETFLTKKEKELLTQEKIKAANESAMEQRYKSPAEIRKVTDVAAEKEALRLRREALRDWENQARAALTNPRVRPPIEGLNKPSPTSAQAEAYAERLYKKAYQQLTPNERKSIKIIIEEEARRAARATSSKVGQGVKRPLPPIGGTALGGLLGIASVVGAASTYNQAMAEAIKEKQRLQSERMN